MGTNYIAPIWRMPENTNKDKLSNYSVDLGAGYNGRAFLCGTVNEEFELNSTVSLFVLFDSVSNSPSGFQNYLFSRARPGFGNPNSNFAVRLEREATGFRIKASYGPYPTSSNIITSQNLYSYDVYHHLAITLSYTGSAYDFTIWVDGVADVPSQSPVTMSALGLPPSNTSPHNFCIGSVGNATTIRTQETFYDGNVAQCSIFDYALNSTQIAYLNEGNNPMAMSNPAKLYWPLADDMNINTASNITYAPNISVGADSVFDFNSTGTRIDLGLESSLGLGGASKYSTSLWFKKSGNTNNCLWGYNYGDANGSGWYYWLNSGSLRIATGKNGLTSGFGYYEISSNNLPLDEWQHILVVFNGTLSAGDNRIKVYHNGVDAVGTYSNSANFPATLPNGNGASNRNAYLGQLQLGNGSFSYNYDGQLSNVQQWNTDLSLSNAETLYNNGQPLMTGTQPQAANLQVWYKLNQSSNWEADSTGNWQIPDATSSFPQSFNFIASQSDAINFGPANGLGFDSQISISAWFNQTPGGGNLQQLVAEDKTGSQRNWGIILVGRIPNFQFFDEAGVQVQLVGTALPEGQWHHILCTATGDTSTNGVKMYINGQLVAQGTASNENIKNDNIQAKIGTQTAPTSTYYFDGKISNVAVWNTDQSSGKDNIYNSGIPATSYTNMPQYWYKLDNTSIWNPAPANYWSFPNSGELTNYGIFNFSN
jgi:hypothetical protein